MNLFVLSGRLVEDIEQLTSANGNTYGKMRIEVEKNFKDQTVAYDTFEIMLFRDMLNMNLKADSRVTVKGRIQDNNYDKDGKVYYHAGLIGDSVEALD